ncbi:MAG: LamG-like jellyroll fold domain-containing protein [Nodosilinea sp.]
MTVQPKYHWQFNEREGNIAKDAIGGVESRFHHTISWDGHGRIGNAVRLPSRESRIVFGPEVGQFGTSNFTVAFGIKILGIDDQNDLNIIGNRSVSGHGNWFSLRLEDKGKMLTFEVDENSKGKNYAIAKTRRLSNLPDKKWHHVALVREGKKVKVYLDGALVAESASKTGVANINSGADVKLGHYTRHTPTGYFEDLRIYHTALNAAEVAALVPSANRPLHEGEIELVAIDNAAVILKQEVEDLSRFSKQFKNLRISQNTAVTLYQDNSFKGTSQKCYADLPDVRLSRLGAFPQSIRIGQAERMSPGKIFENEGLVGKLKSGEVALYENIAYWGKTWVFSEGDTDLSDSLDFRDLPGLNDQVSSIRLGPDTGVTLFKHVNFKVNEEKRETEIEDIVENVPDLRESQVGDDAISSLKIFKTIAPEDVLSSFTTKLSQDYRLVGNDFEEFSAYRTTLRFEPGAGEVKVSATDLTTIEVEGTTHEIDEARSVTLKPNEMNFIMITSEADGLNTPGLKIRTSEMAPNEQVVIFPDEEAHQQIAKLEDDALWNATDAQGNLIVDRKAHSKADVASVQSTIKRTMATVTLADDTAVAKRGARVASGNGRSRIQSSSRVVSGAAIAQPWELKFTSTPDSVDGARIITRTATLQARGLVSASAPENSPENVGIREEAVSQDDFTLLLSQATSNEVAQNSGATGSGGTGRPNVIGIGGVQRVGAIRRIRLGGRIRDAIKKAVSVVVGAVKDVLHVIVKTAEGIIDFVVDTAEKVAEFVEAVVEKVVNGIKKFVEFLQFLFNWDDILDTQRYLVGAINDGFDYAAQQIEAIKAPVSNFMDTLQDTVEEGMNHLITTLGGDPSEVRESGFELPEAAEWFLSKLLGGSKQEDAETTPKVATQTSGDSELENFLFHFTEAFEDGVGAVLRGFEGLGETIATLITNPLKPQLAVVVLVETLRDVVIQMMEAVENLALGFLDAIAAAVKQLKNLLNAEIKIPFISDLFKLIGGGKLTLLNLTGLLLAIPVTVVSKLIFGETPFKNEPPLNFATQTGARLVAEPRASIQTTNNTARENSVRHWGNTGLLADVINGVITGFLDSVPESADQPFEKTAGFGFEIVSLVLSGFSWLASFPSSPDFPGGRPYNVAAHKVSKSKNEQEYWERVMWGWRTAVYWLDVVILMGKGVAAAKGKEVKLQRLKRADETTIGIFFAFSIVDAGLATRYLVTIPKEDEPGLEIADEVISWLPNLLAPLRLAGIKGAVALSLVDGVAAFANYGMGHKLLADDLADL